MARTVAFEGFEEETIEIPEGGGARPRTEGTSRATAGTGTGRQQQRPGTEGTTGAAAGTGTGSGRQYQRPTTTAQHRQAHRLQRRVTDPMQALQEERDNRELMEIKADMAAQYVEDVPLPAVYRSPTPGWRLIPKPLADEVGLRGLGETSDPWDDLPQDEPIPEPTTTVNGNIIASFLDGVTGQQKDDVLLSTLFAQLAANFRYNRSEDPFNWTQAYTRSLENLGWVVPSAEFRRFTSSAATFTIDKVVLDMLAALLGQRGVDLLNSSMEAIKALPEDHGAFVIFDRQSHSQQHGNFLVDQVANTAGGDPTMNVGSFLFRTNETVTRVLWFSFRGGPNTQVAISRNTVVLNTRIFSQVRDAVAARLVQYITNYIKEVPLGEEPQPPALTDGFTSFANWGNSPRPAGFASFR